jgi:hypothetical protein
MAKPKFKTVNIEYDAATKTLYVNQARRDFVPSYAYYCCEALEQKNKIEIVTIVFTIGNSRAYRKEELKGKYEWSELDE